MIFRVGGLGCERWEYQVCEEDRKEKSRSVHGRLRQIQSLRFGQRIER